MASIPEIQVGKMTETKEAMPLLDENGDAPDAAAYRKIMELAEEDPNADSYYSEYENKL
jgi:hypothetical protein